MTDETIRLRLSIEEINLILEALGERPFKLVYRLVNRIQVQASAQLEGQDPGQESNRPEPDPQDSAAGSLLDP